MSAPDFPELIRDLHRFRIGAVAPENAAFFARLRRELPIRIHRFPSGSSHNGWMVPPRWSVRQARVLRRGRVVFDGARHPLGVAMQSKSFRGELSLAELRKHVVTRPDLPGAYSFHCMWQYRPWAADWALSIPHRVFRTFRPGRYRVDLETVREPGEMLVGVYDHRGSSDRTIVFNAHTCHPAQANDDLAGVALLVRLFQELRGRKTSYTYRLVLAPEHLGTVFYLNSLPKAELRRLVSGVFAEMPGTRGAIKVASTFLGNQPVDRALRNAARHHARKHVFVPWRQGAGNDETVWEAPGYEVPFVEVSRSESLITQFREYHTSLDTPALMNPGQLAEFYDVLRRTIDILESDAFLHRRFNGLVCLSNPAYDLYLERPDPAVAKNLADDSEKWGHLLDCLLRYFDGSRSILDIAEAHDLPFDRLYAYLLKFQAKGLVRFQPARIDRLPISKAER